jgi:hypothetical protein
MGIVGRLPFHIKIPTGISSMYELRVVSGSNTWIIPFQSLSISETLNGGISGTLSLNYLAMERYASLFSLTPDGIFASALAEWKLYRDEVLFYAGIINHRTASGSKAQGTSYNLNLLGYEYLLKSRITGNGGVWAYTSDDSADIAWDMINRTNALSDTGITRGLHPTTTNRDKTNRFDPILDSIMDMSATKKANGYDWEVSNQKVFNIFYPKGTLKNNIILDDFNILSWSNNRDMATNLANSITVLGAGSEDDIISETVEDTASQAVWGLQQTTLSEKDTTLAQNLIDKGDAMLANKSTPQDLVTVKVNDKNPLITSYNVGDNLPVKISAIGFDENLRIDKRTIQIERSGEAVVDLSFQYAT